MSDINSVSSVVPEGLSINSKKPAVERKDNLGQDAFLELLITQLNNQDPLNPQESADFVAQLAQFSSLEGIQNLNTGVQDMATSFRSSQALQASALVGRSVLVESNSARSAPGDGISGLYSLENSTGNVSVSIKNSAGVLVNRLELGPQAAGDNEFVWDGKNSAGEAQPSGVYQVEITAIEDGESVRVPVFLAANVNSVTLGANNTMTLNVQGAGSVSLADVKQIL